MKSYGKIQDDKDEIVDIVDRCFSEGYDQGYADGKKEYPKTDYDLVYEYNRGLRNGLEVTHRLLWIWFKVVHQNPNEFSNLLGLNAKLGEDVFDKLFQFSIFEIIEKVEDVENKFDEKEKVVWYDIPAEEMNHEQLVAAVTELRMKIAEYRRKEE